MNTIASQHGKQRAIVVDSRGTWCPPTPLTDLFKAWRTAALGDVIELRATEPTIEKDVRAWAKKSGNKVIEVTHENGLMKIVMRVTKRGKEIMEMSAMKTNVNEPDEIKVAPKGKLQLIIMGGLRLVCALWNQAGSGRSL